MWVRLENDDEAAKLFDLCKVAGMDNLAKRIMSAIADDKNEDLKKVREQAKEQYAQGSDEDVEIDSDSAFSESDNGTWVQAWVWVYDDSKDVLPERDAHDPRPQEADQGGQQGPGEEAGDATLEETRGWNDSTTGRAY